MRRKELAILLMCLSGVILICHGVHEDISWARAFGLLLLGAWHRIIYDKTHNP